MIKQWLIGGALVALVGGSVVRMLSATAVATPPTPKPDAPIQEKPQQIVGQGHWHIAWTVSIPQFADFALSSSGEDVAWTDAKGCVRRISCTSGHTFWRTAPLTGVNHVEISSHGTVAAYSHLNPERTSVVFLDPQTGDAKPRFFAGNGAVWSTAFDENNVAFVGTGGRGIYALEDIPVIKTPDKPRYPTEGMPQSLAVAADAPRIAMGTWSPAAVIGCTLDDQAPCWKSTESETDRTCQVMISANGNRVVELSSRGARHTDGIIRMHDGRTGKKLWEVELPDDSAEPTVLLSADGNTVAVTYRRDSLPDTQNWKLACFNANGNRLFLDKGSALFIPRIVALAADGSLLTVQSGDDVLFTLDRAGNFLSKLRLPADETTGKPAIIERTEVSRDGQTLLLQRHGDKLTLLRTGA